MKYVFMVMMVMMLLPLTAAQISFNQPQPLYNLGDELNTVVIVQPSNAITDFLSVKMVCDGREAELYRSALHLNAGASRDITINTQLTRTIVGDLLGTCSLVASFGSESQTSQQFQLSKTIGVDVALSSTIYNPGEMIRVEGTATKANGDAFSGTIEAQIVGRNWTGTAVASNGIFSFNMTLPEDFAPGQLVMRVHAVEKDVGNQITNEGTHDSSFSVRSVLRNLEIAAENDSLMPGQTIQFTVTAYDQAVNQLEKDIKITLLSPDEKTVMTKLIRSGTAQSITLNDTAAPGYWKIQAETEGMTRKKLFYISENAHVRFEIVNATLIITNTGNVRYTQPIEIVIGDSVYVRDLNLGVGEVKKFRLYAPDADYAVSVKGGEDEGQFSNVPLTGHAIDVGEVREGFKLAYASWFLLVLVALVIVMNLYVRRRGMRLITRKEKPAPAATSSQSTMKMAALTTHQGKKEPATVIAVKTPNGVIPPKAQDVLERARRDGAKVYNDEEYKLVLLSPTLTKSNDHELKGAQYAQDVESAMKEHNSRGRNTVNFGIGAVSGSIISEIKQGKFEFTAVGTLIPGAKRLATLSESNVLLSPTTHRPIMNVIKAEKMNNVGAYKLNTILDRAKHESFLKGFLGRNKGN